MGAGSGVRAVVSGATLRQEAGVAGSHKIKILKLLPVPAPRIAKKVETEVSTAVLRFTPWLRS
jgi:hypothetical protein